MKSIVILCMLLMSSINFAQVGIGTITPDPSSLLDITSTTSGVLVPRMTEIQRLAIPTPATGLLVYQNNNSTGFWYYNGVTWISLSGGSSGGEFQSINGVVQNTTDIYNDDFVFGGSTLDNDGTPFDNNKMFFNKSKGAFRVGNVLGNEWNDVHVGVGSIGLGCNNRASGENSVAIGRAFATGEHSISIGYGFASANGSIGINGGADGIESIALQASATGYRSVSIGDGCHTTGITSFAFGSVNEAIGDYSSAFGYGTTTNGNYAMSFGFNSEANGEKSFVFGDGCTAEGSRSYVLGRQSQAFGNNSFAFGYYNRAFSFNEVVFGYDAPFYTPASTTSNVGTDKLFVVANNGYAMTILKNGKTGLSRVPTTNTLEVEGEASKTTAGAWIGNSDGRLKKNIETISEENALASILKMRGVSYEWNDTQTGAKRPEGIQYGFVA